MNWSNAAFVTLLAVVTLILLLNSDGVDAKRGCATFGHSCYGAMGKRMSPSDLLTNDEVLQDVQQEGNPEIVFTGPRGDLDVETERKMTMQQLYNLSPFVRQWLQSYRKAQEMHNGNK